MYYAVGTMLGENPGHGRGVADVEAFEFMAGIVGDVGDGFQAAGVREFIHVNNLGVSLVDELTDDGGSDETGTTRDDDFQTNLLRFCSGLPLVFLAGKTARS